MTCSLLRVNLAAEEDKERMAAAIEASGETNQQSLLYPIEEDQSPSGKKAVKEYDQQPPTREYMGQPLTPLHQAAMDGNIEELTSLLSSCNGNHDNIDAAAGPKLMTPLHYAADSSTSNKDVDHSTAAKCVYLLLTQGRSNPCMVDSHNRPPFYLASNDTVRNAFRLARSELGEEIWNWTDRARVGPAMTIGDVKNKREKLAEKKRKQRMRQKEKKALEKQRVAEEKRRAEEEEKKKEEQESARRVRAGLKPKSSNEKGSIICDFCQKDCKGRRRSQLFSRLDFIYCSSDCMRRHQRELMAAAATARMKGNAN